MQAIHTKYLGPTNTKGARIKATADGGTATIPYPYELSGCDVHRKAARALCEKLGWEWDHMTGVLPDGSRAHVVRPSSGLTQEHVNTLREYAHDTGPFRVSKLGATNLAAAARAAIKSARGDLSSVRAEIRAALAELDSVTATDDQADAIGCAENALRRALDTIGASSELPTDMVCDVAQALRQARPDTTETTFRPEQRAVVKGQLIGWTYAAVKMSDLMHDKFGLLRSDFMLMCGARED